MAKKKKNRQWHAQFSCENGNCDLFARRRHAVGTFWETRLVGLLGKKTVCLLNGEWSDWGELSQSWNR